MHVERWNRAPRERFGPHTPPTLAAGTRRAGLGSTTNPTHAPRAKTHTASHATTHVTKARRTKNTANAGGADSAAGDGGGRREGRQHATRSGRCHARRDETDTSLTVGQAGGLRVGAVTCLALHSPTRAPGRL